MADLKLITLLSNKAQKLRIHNVMKYHLFVFHFEFRYKGLRFNDHGGYKWR